MNEKVAIVPRWYGSIPSRNGRPLPKNQWARAGRVRKWCVRWYAPDGSRPRQTFDTKEVAEEVARQRAIEFEKYGVQARIRPQRITLGEFVDEVLVLRTGSNGERLSIGNATRYLARIQSEPSARNKPLSLSSTNKHKRILKAAFSMAVKQLGYLSVNPLERLQQDRVADPQPRYVSPDEFNAIVAVCGTMNHPEWWECFLAVSYTAGTRLNEVVHLTWGDIDFEGNTIRICAKSEISGLEAWLPKDRDSRLIPVPARTIDLLTRLHAEAVEGSEFAFVPPERIEWIQERRKGGTWREGQSVLNNVNKNFQRRASKAGVNSVSLHDLRRSCLTNWARALPIHVVRELAGHADIATTQRFYLAVTEQDMNAAREATANALQLDPK